MHPVKLEPFTIDNEQYLAAVNFMDETGNYKTKSTIYKLNTTTGIYYGLGKRIILTRDFFSLDYNKLAQTILGQGRIQRYAR